MVLAANGRLMRRGLTGPYKVVGEGLTVEQAEAYVAGLPGKWKRCGFGIGASGDRPRRVPRGPGSRPRRVGTVSDPELTPEQQAEHEQRIQAHMLRVQAELEAIESRQRRCS